MDTEKKTIKVLEATEKTSKNGGKYLYVKYDTGSASCFIEGLFGVLTAVKANGEPIGCTFQKKGNFVNIIGVDGVQVADARVSRGSQIGQAVARKEAGIKEHTERKENAITEAGIYRDASMFACETWKQFGGEKEVDMLKAAYDYWKKYFGEERR